MCNVLALFLEVFVASFVIEIDCDGIWPRVNFDLVMCKHVHIMFR
jgi:hypothetical protein